MNTLKSLCLATIAVFALLFGAATSISAEALKVNVSTDPFEVSTARCNSGEFAISCMSLEYDQDVVVTISELAEYMGISLDRLRKLNGWSSEVSGDTVIPEGVRVAFGGRV